MKLVKSVKCKLQVTLEEKDILLQTINSFKCACNDILKIAREKKTFNQYKLHHLTYHLIKKRYNLQANLVVRAIARVAQKRKRRPKSFKALSLDLDNRTFRFIERGEMISLSTVKGRLKLKLSIGNYQRGLLKEQHPKMAHLIYQKPKKVFYINFALNKEVMTPFGTKPIGIDLGINNIATCSNGLRFPGKKTQHTRQHYQALRSSLQAKGTKSAKSTLIRLSGKERRWMSNINHIVSRKIVDSIKKGEFIVMENLKGIRKTAKVRKKQRHIHNSWSFSQLQLFVEYKALEKGIPVTYIDPRNTSKTCSRCGEIGNRSGHFFSCFCGYRNNADFNASYNISLKGNAFKDGLSPTSPKVAPVEAKASEELRLRVATS